RPYNQHKSNPMTRETLVPVDVSSAAYFGAGLVAQVSNLPYRGFPIRTRQSIWKVSRLEVGDTAGWKPALRNGSHVCLAICLLFVLAGSNAIAARFEAANRPFPQPSQSKVTFESDIRPLLSQYCYGCHGEKKKGDLDLRIYQD